MSDTTAGWYPDPTHRFELRFHNGQSWTADVSTNGERFVDPNGTNPTVTRPNTQHHYDQAGQQAGLDQTGNNPPENNSPATAAMVLGIIAIGIGWMPVIVAFGAVAAIAAIALGFAGRKRAKRTGVGGASALAGLITGFVAVLVCVGGVIFTIVMLRAISDFDNPALNEASITSCVRSGDEVTAIGELTNLSSGDADFSVRVHFVRAGTDNPRRQALLALGTVGAKEQVTFEVTRTISLDDIDCIVAAVRGPMPYGVDPGT